MKRALIACGLLCVSVPAHAMAEEPICADRPGLSTPACSVPQGKVQVETGLVDWTHDDGGGVESDTLTLGGSAVKVGITDRLHLEVDFAPYVRVREDLGGSTSRLSGFGDIAVAAKYRVSTATAPVQMAVVPFIKIPTAKRSLGNGKVEGGLIVPIGYTIPETALSLALSPEIDVNSDPDGSGYHLATAQVIGLGASLAPALSASVELAGYWDFLPDGTVRQFLFGGSAALLLSNDLQVDAGINLGLNRESPDLELYSGIALRF